MAITEQPWTSTASDAIGRQLTMLPASVLACLAKGDLDTARDMFHPSLTPYMISGECRGCWERRNRQLEKTPDDGMWITRVVLDTSSDTVVGRAGFHSMPDPDGVVEVGYAIDPLHRRRGHARAALRILLEMAAGDSRVAAVRASVCPANAPSATLVESYGFSRIGEQIDPEDGLEIVYELQMR